ncbi:MAG: hypothetical protein AABW80_05260 [Nanoarchaeota archaeon]
MGEVERIILKRIYVGKASLFGLYYGAFTGLIIGFIAFLAVFISNRLETWLGDMVNMSGFALAFILAVIIFISVTVIGLIGAFLAVLIYNIVASLGGEINFDLEEYVQMQNRLEGQVEKRPAEFVEEMPMQKPVSLPANNLVNAPTNIQRSQPPRLVNQFNPNYNPSFRRAY